MLAAPAFAQEPQENCGIEITSVSMQRNGSMMTVSMDMNLADFDLAGNRVAVFAPAIASECDTLTLRPVGLYSRDRWYQYLRAGDGPVSGEEETPIRWSKRPDMLAYSETVPYEEWMNGSRLVLTRRDYACCNNLLSSNSAPVGGGYREVEFVPVFRYAVPEIPEKEETVKTRELSGRAFIDFPVNRTEIMPEYRSNVRELTKIIATIDSVRNDSDITVRSIGIKGFASPEGTYENNTRLARGRTEALKQYVQTLCRFPDNFIATDYEPEDWAGLRAFVYASDMKHRQEILDVIDDGTLDPDTKDWRIKLRWPEEYDYLLQTIYPALRHSDYTIEYTIRNFTDTDEIAVMIDMAPQKLSFVEMMRYAQTLEPGSEAYNDVFETAVRIYPENEEANINAANAAMQRSDLKSAKKYLSKSGGSAEADYARGIFAALNGDYGTAEELIRNSGLTGTEDILEHIGEVKQYR